MKVLLAILITLALLPSHTFSASMRMCKDTEGNVTFSQTVCPKGTTSRRNVYVAPAQAPIKGLRSGERHELSRIRQRDYQRSQRIKQQYAKEQRQRASNKNVAAIASRDKQKKQQISQIERDMRRGAISKRVGHELISNIQSGKSTSQSSDSTESKTTPPRPQFYTRVKNGYVNQQTGKFHPGNDKGFFNTETGKFVPGNKSGAYSPD